MKRIMQIIQFGILISLTLMLGATPFSSVTQASGGSIAEASPFSATADYSSEIEKRIRSGQVSTADLIMEDHPRLWLRGDWDWDRNNIGSFAWRITHGEPCNSEDDPSCDTSISEFFYVTCGVDYGADYMFGQTRGTYRRRILEPIIAGIAVRLNWPDILPMDVPWTSKNPDYDPQHTTDEYFADARSKLRYLTLERDIAHEWPWDAVVEGSVGYDWLVDEVYSDGAPVLSDTDKQEIQQGLIANAEYVKANADGSERLFQSAEISNYVYVMVGMALYEPARINDPTYAQVNAKAREYLDDFDAYWIGKILPALNEQGGDGGWHGGQSSGEDGFDFMSEGGVIPWQIAPILFAHMTATGQSIEDSVFSTGVMKYAVEFQNQMIRPGGEAYYDIQPVSSSRYVWILPMQMYSRRRFSTDIEQQSLGELGGWVRAYVSQDDVDAGSHDMRGQLLFEDKWVNPRSPEEIGFGMTRQFEQLGWVFMRSGFTSADDLSAIFIAQRYHWSELNTYSQNSFTLERKGKLIEGYQNSLFIDGQYQRTISNFPTITDGIEAYAPGSVYDVGPGILAFESNDVYDYMLGDATNAYDASELSRFTRQVVYVKPDIFVIFDRVVTHNSGTEKKWVVDPAATPQDQGNGLITVDNGSGALWIKRLLPTSASVSLTDAEIAVVPSQSNTETFFLHVMQAVNTGASAGQVAVDDATVVQEGDWFHVQVADHQTSFSRDGEFKFDGGTVEIKEDVNQDGVVNDEDVQLCVRVILGLEINPLIVVRSDVNDDGEVNAVDVQQILVKMLTAS
jgi:hypothetical protein